MNDDLFSAALASRDRRIARLEQQLADAHARIAELECERDPVLGSGGVLLLPARRWSGFVEKEARRALDAINPAHHAPKHVERAVERVRAYRRKAGIAEDVVERDAQAFRDALNARINSIGGRTGDTGNSGGAA